MTWRIILVAFAVFLQYDAVSAQESKVPSKTTAAELWNPYTWFYPYAIAASEGYRDYYIKAQKATNDLYQQIYETNAFPWVTGNWGPAPGGKPNSNGQENKPKEENKPEKPKEENKPEKPKDEDKPEKPKDEDKPEKPKEEKKPEQPKEENKPDEGAGAKVETDDAKAKAEADSEKGKANAEVTEKKPEKDDEKKDDA